MLLGGFFIYFFKIRYILKEKTNMGKKTNKGKGGTNTKEIIENVNKSTTPTEVNTELVDNEVKCEPQEADSSEIQKQKTIGFDDLYYAKKCNEILMSYYNNLVRIVPTQDNEYHNVLSKLNNLKSIDNRIMNKMEEKILGIDIC